MDVHLAFASIGVNRVVNALDWSLDGRVAYGGHNSVVIYNPEEAKVVSTLVGHAAKVDCVKWLPDLGLPSSRSTNARPSAALATGSADNSIRIWAVHDASAEVPWECLAELQGHSGPVTTLAAHAVSSGGVASTSISGQGEQSGGVMLVSAAGDAEVHIWMYRAVSDMAGSTAGAATSGTADADGVSGLEGAAAMTAAGAVTPVRGGRQDWQLLQRIRMGNKIQHAVALTHLPHDPAWLLLATGGTDGVVHLHVRAPGSTDAQFVPSCRLTGHENWIRSLAICHVRPSAAAAAAAAAPAAAASGSAAATAGTTSAAPMAGALNELVLASASQDRYARVWSIKVDVPAPSCVSQTNPFGSAPAGAGGPQPPAAAAAADDPFARLISRYAPKPLIQADSCRYCVSSEALLVGHEDWVHSVCWRPLTSGQSSGSSDSCSTSNGGGGGALARSDLCLMTASMDRTMVLWHYKVGSGLWMNETSVGDAGASCLGYFGGIFSPDGQHILAHGFTGALHLWRSPTTPGGLWQPVHALGGHFGAVVQARWGVDGACLMSVSEDQTARMFTTVGASGHWCEIARMQVHGHDFSCIAPIPHQQQYCYASGSEEKVLRVFESPTAFLDTLDIARGRPAGSSSSSRSGGGGSSGAGGRKHGSALGAAVNALGLTNKAVFADPDDSGAVINARDAPPDNAGPGYSEGSDLVPASTPAAVSGPPLEEHLCQNTLWPEEHKLYGHGNDIYCAAASPDGKYLASASRAQTAAAAAIRVWRTDRPAGGTNPGWRCVAQLDAHTLTITQLAWSSSSGRMLAAASRDRSFSVFRRASSSGDVLSAAAAVPEAAVQHQAVADGTSSGSRTVPGDGAAAESAVLPAAVAAGPASLIPAKADTWSVVAGEKVSPADAGGTEDIFVLLQRVKAAHGRVIWGIAWSPDDRLLATGSRDESVKLWAVEPATVTQQQQQGGTGGGGNATAAGAAACSVSSRPVASLPALGAAVTAVAFAPAGGTGGDESSGATSCSDYTLAVGLEDGQIHIWRIERGSAGADAAGSSSTGGGTGGTLLVRRLWEATVYQRHAAAVRSLDWRRACGEGDGGATILELASAGDDHAVRIFECAL